MKITLPIFLCLYMFTTVGQEYSCEEYGQQARVNAKSGLKLRKDPTLNSEVLLSVPYWALVDVCGLAYVSDTIEGIVAGWKKVRFQETEGYMFGGFLVDEDTSHVKPKGYRFMMEGSLCASVNYDPKLNWYGVYRKDSYDTIIKVDVSISGITLSNKEKMGDAVLSVRTNYSDSIFSLFLFGTKEEILESSVYNYQYEPHFLYPGQLQSVYSRATRHSKNMFGSWELYALGTVTDFKYCPLLEDYELVLTEDRERDKLDQNIYAEIGFKGECRMSQLFWFGDLDMDMKPDMIFMAASNSRADYHLFLSSEALPNEYVHKVDQWTSCNCY